MTKLTESQLAEIAERREKSKPGKPEQLGGTSWQVQIPDLSDYNKFVLKAPSDIDALLAHIAAVTAERDEAKRAIVGQRARWGGVVWKVVGINYLGTFDLERFEDRPDGRYKMGGSCVFGLPRNHPHFAELIDAEAELAAANQRAADAKKELAEIKGNAGWFLAWQKKNEHPQDAAPRQE